jgi:hypothetical protein
VFVVTQVTLGPVLSLTKFLYTSGDSVCGQGCGIANRASAVDDENDDHAQEKDVYGSEHNGWRKETHHTGARLMARLYPRGAK